MAERQFTYTWPDKPHDFVAKDGELRIGRAYRLTGGLNVTEVELVRRPRVA
jgi:hypothetical protein